MEKLLKNLITNLQILFFKAELTTDDLSKYEIILKEIISSNKEKA